MKAKIIGFTKFPDGQDKDCEAITDKGEKIIIDPFVGCSWKYEERNHLLNEWVEDEEAWENNGVWLTNEHSFRIIHPMENNPTPHTDQFEEIDLEKAAMKAGEVRSNELVIPIGIARMMLHHIRRETEKGMMEKVKGISDREVDGSWLPDGMHAYYDDDLEKIFETESDNSTKK